MRGNLFDRTKQNKGLFCNSVKPFFINRSGAGSGKILISENSKIISEQSEIPGIMNDFFVNVAADIVKITLFLNFKIIPVFLKLRNKSTHHL